MIMPTYILVQIAHEVDDFYGGEEWNVALSTMATEDFQEWHILMICQIVARAVATLDCEIKTPELAPPTTKPEWFTIENIPLLGLGVTIGKFCRRLLRRA